jgi:putative transposase
MPYCQLFYHIVWATKNRAPLISEAIESKVHALIRTKAVDLGAIVYGLNGIADHVHLVASIPPRLAVATFIGQVKGASSALFNKTGHDIHLAWQDEYGAFSFDASRLPNYLAYVANQKAHHAQQTSIPVLERCDNPHPATFGEPMTTYLCDDALWRRELAQM